jgi:hypothetical protein
MKSKSKNYGFPYDYSYQKPLHVFINEQTKKQVSFYQDGQKIAIVERDNNRQQRVLVDENAFNNMLGILDRNGWKEIPA